MRLVVGTNFDDCLLEGLRGTPTTHIFGSFQKSLTGHGKASFLLPKIDETRFRDHVQRARENGIKFMYLMNTATLSGREYDPVFRTRLMEEVKKVVDAGVGGFVVGLPYLLKMIKRDYPDLEVSISSYARVQSVREVEEYISLGADTVIIHEDVNRDFGLLTRLGEMVRDQRVDVELIANNSCLYGCPYRRTHDITSSESSREGGPQFWFEYPILLCAIDLRNDLSNLIRMRWIRPEGLKVYEEIGIDRFKIASRNKGTEWTLRAVRAYSSRNYQGNLLDIVSYPQGRAVPKAVRAVSDIDYYDLLTRVEVDNTAFPANWLGYFKVNQCSSVSCEQCGYCGRIAERTVRVGSTPLPQRNIKRVDAPLDLIEKWRGVRDGGSKGS